jgi:hypothetical protein
MRSGIGENASGIRKPTDSGERYTVVDEVVASSPVAISGCERECGVVESSLEDQRRCDIPVR